MAEYERLKGLPYYSTYPERREANQNELGYYMYRKPPMKE